MKTYLRILSLCILLAACVVAPNASAQQIGGVTPFGFPNFSPAAQSFTATAQTGAKINLGGYSSGTIEVYGTITTVTFAIQGSNDGGVNWFALPTAVITAPGTLAATQTATAAAMYRVNLAALTNVRFVTSGTFTGTGVFIKITASGNEGSV